MRSIAVWGIAVLVPLAGAGAVSFFHNDSSGATATQRASTMAWPAATQSSSRASVASRQPTAIAPVGDLIAGLEQRLAQNPADSKGWALLAQSHAFLGNTDAAETALAQAVALGLDENDLRHRVGLAARASDSSAGDPDRGATTTVVRGIVDVSDERLASRLEQPGSKLFVTARAPGGSPMPIAVLAAEPSSYPYEYALGDEDTMLPGTRLSDFSELAISARLAISGSAERSDGDLESEVALIDVASARSVELLLRAH
jgi:cytochrome c-type biogenesis protein CcmH